jgi:cell division protein ZapE
MVNSVSASASALRNRLQSAVEHRSVTLGFELDSAQQRALQEISSAVAAAVDGRTAEARHSVGDGADTAQQSQPRGVYLWGPAGRGKTWLMSEIFSALCAPDTVGAINPSKATGPGVAAHSGRETEPALRGYRTHFHAFFHTLHRVLWRLRDCPSPFEAATTELYSDAAVVFFDEFHVHDSGDARLLQGILDSLLRRGVVVLATSNYEPKDLLPNPTYHHLFDEGIATIENTFSVVELNDGSDYRRETEPVTRAGFSAGRWITPGTDAQLSAAGLARPGAASISVLEAGGHAFTALAAHDGRVWFHAEDVIESATAISDFVGWADRFTEWILDELPPLKSLSSAARQRLVGLVDVLSDAGCTLTVISMVDQDAFSRDAALPLDSERMLSRLALLDRD